MSVGIPGPQSLTIEDLPKLVAAVAAVDPDRVALSHGGTEISYGRLNDELVTLDTAMGWGIGGGCPGSCCRFHGAARADRQRGRRSRRGGRPSHHRRHFDRGGRVGVRCTRDPRRHSSTSRSSGRRMRSRWITPERSSLTRSSTRERTAWPVNSSRQVSDRTASSVSRCVDRSISSSRCTRSSRPAARTFHSTRIILPTVSLTYSRSRSPRLCSHERPMPWCCRTVRPRSTSTPSTCRVVPRQLSPTPTGWRRCARTTLRMSSSRPDRPDAPKALQSLTVPSSRTCNGVRPSTDSLPTT